MVFVVFGRLILRLVNVCHGLYTSYFRLDAKSVHLGWGENVNFCGECAQFGQQIVHLMWSKT